MSTKWYDVTPGWILLYEEAFLESLARTLPEGARVVNIGAGAGTSTSAILRGTNHLHQFQMASVDVDGCDEEVELLTELGLLDYSRYRSVKEDSNLFGKSLAEPLDLVFVDGQHTEKQVFADIRTFGKLLKPGGLIVCHDFEDQRQKGVTRAIKRHFFYKNAPWRNWLKVGRVLYTIAFMKPDGDMDWTKGRINND